MVKKSSKQPTIDTNSILGLINAERQKAGLAPVKMHDGLSKAAMDKGMDMVQKKYFAHANKEGKHGYNFITDNKIAYNSAGENLGNGFKDSARLTSKWMKSQSHKANIMNPKYTDMGLAIVPIRNKGKMSNYIVQLFTEPYSGRTALGVKR